LWVGIGGPTSGTLSLSACEEAASVVTVLNAGLVTGTKALRRSGDAMLFCKVLANISDKSEKGKKRREDM